ncbi:Uma2 family endonuclease [Nodularia spumigena CS-591/04]|uniref:Uma2 family endonuclease n=1 Tax=Nodularia spumigena TaxID=70799 RepID=UPI00232D68D5|nr:Uma2 family endonuclease [Nodularia spumigena]MDB9323200.1 Uma2 family endonuclease [Nodularia spumigena CS-591/07A]MDB9333292.1 Uma2 family endonuclease [Nodularia spumigena CS-591/04]
MYQVDPPLPPTETLPTMYDLPSENQEEPGLPDEFHLLQPELLRITFRPPSYAEDNIFTASDLNLYYDPHHPQWYKRPDWFAVLGASRFYNQTELRLSYVTWQEGINPFVAVELISPGTEAEDLGRSLREVNQPPNKWSVYEQILRVPYYFAFNRYTNEFHCFGLMMNRYQPLSVNGLGVWLEEAELGLGLWDGEYQGLKRLWLRWYDRDNNWLLTPVEQEKQRVEQEKQRAEQEKQRAEQEKQRAEQEKQRADSAELENAKLRQLLLEQGISLPNGH